MARGKCDIDD